MRTQNQKIKVAVGMSGGVDSSVAALLLMQQGFDVIGLFMKLWHDPCGTGQNACCDEKALADAHAVAKKIGIPLYVADVRKEFKEAVTDYFIDEYKNCRTPNPCVVCNKKIKFGWLLDFAKKIGCEYLATGHYARIVQSLEFSVQSLESSVKSLEFSVQRSAFRVQRSEFSVKSKNSKSYVISTPRQDEGGEILSELEDLSAGFAARDDNGEKGMAPDGNENKQFSLLKAKDEKKDQSYFLYRLSQEQLSHIIFPVGEMTKDEVRKIAKENGLPVHEKKESQEICFVEDDYRSFLKRNLGKEAFGAGEIVDTEGNIIGRHEGLINYTIGQRKGINVSGIRYNVLGKEQDQIHNTNYVIRNMDRKPLYVVGFDKDKNKLIVGEDKDLFKKKFIIGDAVWKDSNIELGIRNDELGDIKVKIRYKAATVPCTINPLIPNTKYLIRLSRPVRAVTPGQSAVFYQNDKVIGGGIIELI